MNNIDNVYDREGTVRYRVVRASDYAHELGGTAATTTTVAAATSSSSSSTTAATVVTAHATATTTTTMTAATTSAGAASAAAVGGGGGGGGGADVVRVCSIAARYGPHTSTAALPPHARKATMRSTRDAVTGLRAGADDGDGDEASAHSAWTTVKALETVLPAQRVNAATTTRSTNTKTNAAAEGSVGDEGDVWLRAAATTSTSVDEVVQLLEHLQRRTRDEQARPRGVLCGTREAIMRDGFDEVLRQVTVRCPERGLLRELDVDMAATTAAYDTLFDHACQYAARKSIERDLRSHLHDDKAALESDVRRLDKRVSELRAKYAGMQRRFDEQRAATRQLHADEVAYLKKAHMQIVSEVKRLMALEKASKGGSSSSNNNAAGGGGG